MGPFFIYHQPKQIWYPHWYSAPFRHEVSLAFMNIRLVKFHETLVKLPCRLIGVSSPEFMILWPTFSLLKAWFKSQIVEFPTVKAISSISGVYACWETLTVTTIDGGIFRSKLLGQSQLVVLVDLRWLQQPTHLSGSLTLRLFGCLLSCLSVFSVEVGVISGKLFQLDEEVTDIELESGQIIALSEERFNELSNLCTKQR